MTNDDLTYGPDGFLDMSQFEDVDLSPEERAEFERALRATDEPADRDEEAFERALLDLDASETGPRPLGRRRRPSARSTSGRGRRIRVVTLAAAAAAAVLVVALAAFGRSTTVDDESSEAVVEVESTEATAEVVVPGSGPPPRILEPSAAEGLGMYVQGDVGPGGGDEIVVVDTLVAGCSLEPTSCTLTVAADADGRLIARVEPGDEGDTTPSPDESVGFFLGDGSISRMMWAGSPGAVSLPGVPIEHGGLDAYQTPFTRTDARAVGATDLCIELSDNGPAPLALHICSAIPFDD